MAQPLPAGQMDLDRHAGRGAGPTRSAQGFLLIRRKAAGDTDFADEPGEHLRFLLRAAKIVNQPFGQLFDAADFYPLRVRRFQIEPGTHNDVQTGQPRDARQRFRIAANADIGRVDYRFSAKGAIFSQLVNRNVDIKQLTVIAAHQRVERQFAKVFHFHRHFGKMAIAAAAGRHPFAGGIQQNMLMHQSNAHFVNRQWAKHSHYVTAANANRQRGGMAKN
ncbi:Uncharacterised protein [Klebsiella pneumoniae]|nr:Uncharacterised protein [Klebsiella pneumoniae]